MHRRRVSPFGASARWSCAWAGSAVRPLTLAFRLSFPLATAQLAGAKLAATGARHAPILAELWAVVAALLR